MHTQEEKQGRKREEEEEENLGGKTHHLWLMPVNLLF